MVDLENISKNNCKYWKDCSIPANYYFNNQSKDDLSWLIIEGSPTQKQLTEAYNAIEDEYYSLKKDNLSEQKNRSRLKAGVIQAKISLSMNLLNFFGLIPVTNHQANEAFDKLKKIGVRFKSTLTPVEKIEVLKNQYIPSWETEIEIELDNIKDQSKKQSVSYEDALQWICDVKGRHLPEDISLRMFISAEKSAIKQIKRLQKG